MYTSYQTIGSTSQIGEAKLEGKTITHIRSNTHTSDLRGVKELNFVGTSQIVFKRILCHRPDTTIIFVPGV